GYRHHGDAHGQAQVRALLAPPGRRGFGAGASADLRPLRVQHRRPRGRPPVVLNAPAKPNALPWLVVSVVVIVLDQLTKWCVLTSLPEYTAIPVIEGFWTWYRTHSTGAEISFLAGGEGLQRRRFTVPACGSS